MLDCPQSNYKNENDNVILLHSLQPSFLFFFYSFICCCFRKWLPFRNFTVGIRYKAAVLPHKQTLCGFKMSFAVNVSFVPEHQRCCRSGGQLEQSDDWCTTSEGLETTEKSNLSQSTWCIILPLICGQGKKKMTHGAAFQNLVSCPTRSQEKT